MAVTYDYAKLQRAISTGEERKAKREQRVNNIKTLDESAAKVNEAKAANSISGKSKLEKKKTQQNKKAAAVGATSAAKSSSVKKTTGYKKSAVNTDTLKATKKIAESQEKKASGKTLPKSNKRNVSQTAPTGKRLNEEQQLIQAKALMADNLPTKIQRGVVGTSNAYTNAVLGAAPALLTGEKTFKPSQALVDAGVTDTTAYKVGEFIGNLGGYATSSMLMNTAASNAVAKALSKTKLAQMSIGGAARPTYQAAEKLTKGQKVLRSVGRNLADTATVGAIQNAAIAREQGLEGEDFWDDFAKNQALDLAFGMAGDAVAAGAKPIIKAIGDSKLVQNSKRAKELNKNAKIFMEMNAPKEAETPKTSKVSDILKAAVKAAEPVTEVAENSTKATARVKKAQKAEGRGFDFKIYEGEPHGEKYKIETHPGFLSGKHDVHSVYFENVPNEITRANMRELGMRYNKRDHSWRIGANKATKEEIAEAIAQDTTPWQRRHNEAVVERRKNIKNSTRKTSTPMDSAVNTSEIDSIEPNQSAVVSGVTVKRSADGEWYSVKDGNKMRSFSREGLEEFLATAEPKTVRKPPRTTERSNVIDARTKLMDAEMQYETAYNKAPGEDEMLDSYDKRIESLNNKLELAEEKRLPRGVDGRKLSKPSTVELPKAEPQLKETGGRKLKPNGADVNQFHPKYKQSTTKLNEVLPEGEKHIYETETHKQRNYAAAQRLDVDRQGEVEDLFNKEHWNTEDTATAAQAISYEFRKGNDDEAIRLAKRAADQMSLRGQELEAAKHFKETTIEGKIYKAELESKRVIKDIQKKNPNRIKNIESETSEVTDVIKKAFEGSKSKEEVLEKFDKGFDSLLESKGKKNKKVPLREQVRKLVENGNYESEQVVEGILDDVDSLIKQKNGIATLDKEKAHKIVEYMKKAEAATDDYQKRMWTAKADQIIANIEDATWHDKFRSWQRISLLSNPKTLITRNAGGNALLAGAENIKDYPAAFFDTLVSLKTGERTTMVGGGKGIAQVKGFGKGFKEQVKDIKYGVDTSPSRSQYELPNKTIWDVDKANGKFARVGTKTMNFLDQFISKSLQFGDRPFYEAAYQGRKAELEKLVAKGKSKLTAAEIEESARLFALDRTFQSDTWLSKRASDIKRPLGIVGDLIMPFTKTPANILDKLLDYSPVGLGRALHELTKTSKGTFDQKRFVDVLGRTFTGGGVIMLGYVLSRDGLMTTDIYSETGGKELDAARKFAGEQDYSVKIGDTYISVDWADPVGSLLMIGADFEKGLGDEGELVNAIYGSTKAAVDGVFNRSFMSGLANLLGGEGEISDKIVDGLIEQTSQITPNILVSTTKIIDPVKRETYDANPLKKQWNVIKSRTPGLSKTLPAKKDITGETVYHYQGRDTKDRALEALLLPYNKSTKNDNQVNDYLLNMYNKTGEKGILLDKADKKFAYEDVEYKIKNAEEYSRYQEVQGKAASKAIKELIKTKEYKNMSQDEKVSALTNAVNAAKDKAREDFLIRTGAYTKEQYDYTKLNDTQKAAVDEGDITAVKLRKLKDKAATVGVDGASSGVSVALALGGEKLSDLKAFNSKVKEQHISSARKLKSLGYTVESYEAEKKLIEDKYDANNNGSIDKDEYKAYFKKQGYGYDQSAALYMAMTGGDKY